MSSSKKKTAPKGTVENPHRLKTTDWDIYEALPRLPVGVTDAFLIYSDEEGTGNWTFEDWENTESKAKITAKLTLRVNRERWVYQQEQKWRRANSSNQKSIDLFQAKITADSTDKELEKITKEMQRVRDNLKDNPPAVMPTFKKSDSPAKVKWVRVRITTDHMDGELL